MEYSEFRDIFSTACAKNNISIPNETQLQRFYDFTVFLMKINETTNLTAIRNVPEVIYKHYIDSLTVSNLIPQNARILDLGCGPGFPSIPLAIYRDDLSLASLDSTAKKITFVQQSASLLGLSNIKALSGRAEDIKTRRELGEFDVVVSRAVARLNVLCELCIPYLKIGGNLIAMKGAKAEEELSEVQKAIKMLGGELLEVRKAPLATESGSEDRGLIIIRKKSVTPAKYPRAYAAILKKPL